MIIQKILTDIIKKLKSYKGSTNIILTKIRD